jgi:hypothetical protein
MKKYIIVEDNGRNAFKTRERVIERTKCEPEQVAVVLSLGEEDDDIAHAADEAVKECKSETIDRCIFILDLAYTDSPNPGQLRHGIRILRKIAELLEGDSNAFVRNSRYRVLLMTVQDPGSLSDLNHILGLPPNTASILPVRMPADVTTCSAFVDSRIIPIVMRGANNWIEEIAFAWSVE